MTQKRSLSILFAGILLCNVLCIPTRASEIDPSQITLSAPRATDHFDTTIPPDSIMSVDDPKFSMEVGETVWINATYSPRNASVDFGVIDSRGTFFSINVSDGNIDAKLEISKRGMYQFAIRNNSSNPITVSGFVSY